MSFPVSVCIIAKNEEKYIEECLKLLLPYGMELVVTDTGSGDRTREIASKYADKVLDFTWTGDFSAARNFCAAHATNNWILAIDCDEFVQRMDLQALRQYMQKHPKGMGKMKITNIARRNSGELGYVQEEIARFYNKNFYAFLYPVHEVVAPKNPISGEKCDFLVPMEVIHHGYNISPEEMHKKQERNLQMLYDTLAHGNERGAYTYFQIGQSEQAVGNTEQAAVNYEKCLEIETDTSLQYIRNCIIELATAYAQMEKPLKALELMERYRDRVKTADFTYTYGLALLGNRQPLQALSQFVLVSMMTDKECLGENLMYCYRNIIQLYKLFGEEQMAKPFQEKYEACLKEHKRILELC